MKRERFYTDNIGPDKDKERATWDKGVGLLNSIDDVTELRIIINTRNNTGYIKRLFGEKYVERLFTGISPNRNNSQLIKLDTVRTAKEFGPKRILVAFGLTSDELFILDEFRDVAAIVAYPSTRSSSLNWAKTWQAEEVISKQQAESYQLPSSLVVTALKELTRQINLKTGIINPHDEELARSYVWALHQEEQYLPGKECAALLISKLKWSYDHAMDLTALIAKLNQGRRIRVGKRISPEELIRNWKKFPEVVDA